MNLGAQCAGDHGAVRSSLATNLTKMSTTTKATLTNAESGEACFVNSATERHDGQDSLAMARRDTSISYIGLGVGAAAIVTGVCPH